MVGYGALQGTGMAEKLYFFLQINFSLGLKEDFNYTHFDLSLYFLID